MPTNLPPEYFDAEEHYRAATTREEKVERLEALISTVPKHKGTDKLRADLRRRLSKLKSETQAGGKGATRHVSAYHIPREGAGQVAVVGPANTGKSSLVHLLTNATPEVADFPYSTWGPTPGMMDVRGVQIQLIDTPPLDREYVEPDMLDLIRRSDLILLVVDLQDFPIEQIEQSVDLLIEHYIVPDRLREDYPDLRYRYVPLLVVVNKTDDPARDEDFTVLCELLEDAWPMVPVAANSGRNMQALQDAVVERLELIRVYAKPPGEEPDLSTPFVMKRGGTVEEFAEKVHRDFYENLKSARVWGSGAFDGQMVARDHVLEDGDVVELRT